MAYESADEKAVLLNPRRYVMGRPTFRALDCRPPTKPGDPLPMEFVMGTNRCDVWEVEYKSGKSQPAGGLSCVRFRTLARLTQGA
jgi:hypothetical protein